MSTAPFSLEAYPLVGKAPSGPAHEVVTVVNKGSKSLSITAHTTVLHGPCAQLQFTPESFTLKPGQSQHVTVSAPAGNVDYLASFSGKIPGSGFGVGAAIGTRLVIGNVNTTAHTTVCAAPKASPINTSTSNGFPVWGFALIALAVVALVVVVVKRMRNRRTS